MEKKNYSKEVANICNKLMCILTITNMKQNILTTDL